VLLITAGLLAPLLAFEVGVRLFGPFLLGDYNIHGFKSPHPVYGLFPRPYARTWNKTSEFAAYVELNARGLRGPDIAVPKPPGRRRIVVLGDSFTFGAQVPEAETAVAVLQRRMRDELGDPTIEVVNAGVESWGTGHQHLFWQHDGQPLEPDLVILAFFVGNDVEDNTFAMDSHKNQPGRVHYTVDATGALVLRPVQVPELTERDVWATELRRRSELYSLVEVWPHHLRDFWKVAEERGPSRKGLSIFRREYSAGTQQAWTVTEALIDDLRDRVEATGARFLVVGIPSPVQFYPDNREIWDLTGKDGERHLDWGRPSRELDTITARNGVDLLDLKPTFERSIAEGAPRLYFLPDNHWTTAGNALAADTIARRILADGLLTAPASR